MGEEKKRGMGEGRNKVFLLVLKGRWHRSTTQYSGGFCIAMRSHGAAVLQPWPFPAAALLLWEKIPGCFVCLLQGSLLMHFLAKIQTEIRTAAWS